MVGALPLVQPSPNVPDGKEMRERAKRKIKASILTFRELPSFPSMDGDSLGGNSSFCLDGSCCPESVLMVGLCIGSSRTLF